MIPGEGGLDLIDDGKPRASGDDPIPPDVDLLEET